MICFASVLFDQRSFFIFYENKMCRELERGNLSWRLSPVRDHNDTNLLVGFGSERAKELQ